MLTLNFRRKSGTGNSNFFNTRIHMPISCYPMRTWYTKIGR